MENEYEICTGIELDSKLEQFDNSKHKRRMSTEEDIEQIKSSLKELETERDDIQLKCIKAELELSIENLIARYKELEDKNKTLETLLQGNLYQMYLYYKELAGRYQANSISKDKVKEKIEEIKLSLKDDCLALHEFQRLAKIDVLEELLREEK